MKVSIIMPTYNDATHIASSIESVINQTHTHWELLIMDDGSKDNTKEIVTNFQDNRINYYRQENQGQLVALNNLCQYITGDIVVMLHSDDALYHTTSLENNIKHFENSELDGLYGDLHQFFDSGRPDEIIKAPACINRKTVENLLMLLGSNIIFDHFFVRRTIFEQYVRHNYFKYYMPYWLKFETNSLSSLNLKYTATPWYHYRVYDQNYTNSVIGNFEVYFTRFRTILFLSDYMTIPFPLIQKELLRRFKVKALVLNKKASKKHIAKCYEANIKSMKKRTSDAYTDYFEQLVLFYKSRSSHKIDLKSPITIEYTPAEARSFFSDLRSGTLLPLTAELLTFLPSGFNTIIVKNKDEKNKLIELLRFLCIQTNVFCN